MVTRPDCDAWAGAAQSQSPHSEPGRSQLLHTESQSSYQQTQQLTQQRRNSFRFRYSDPQQSNQPTQTSVSRAAAARIKMDTQKSFKERRSYGEFLLELEVILRVV